MSIISNCSEVSIRDAASALLKGNLVAFPTETVYGLGGDALNAGAVDLIYHTKGRPKDHPLIVHISSIKHLDMWARNVPEYAIKLARSFWPGPMTLILQRTGLAKDYITGGQDNVGIRIPSHKVALALLSEFESQGGLGVAAPSANRFGKLSPTSAADVQVELIKYLQPKDIILDGGQSSIGLESTIINCTQDTPIILRPGAITQKMVNLSLGKSFEVESNNNDIQVRTSGLLESHYSPKARVFLAGIPKEGDGLIALASLSTPPSVIRLASPVNDKEFAAVLYQALRLADLKKLDRVFVIPPTGEGIAIAINDRLRRCAFKG